MKMLSHIKPGYDAKKFVLRDLIDCLVLVDQWLSS